MLLRPCAAAAGVSLHVNTTAYVFWFRLLPKQKDFSMSQAICKCGSISETVQDREVTNRKLYIAYGISSGRSDDYYEQLSRLLTY